MEMTCPSFDSEILEKGKCMVFVMKFGV